VVVAGLIVVVVVSVLVVRAGIAYLDGASSAPARPAPDSATVIDLTDVLPGASSVPTARQWMVRGFDATEAARWIGHGFGPDHAFLFHSLGIDAPTAARLRTAGLEDSALVALVEEASFARDDGHERLLELAEKGPQLAAQALPWLRVGATTEQAVRYAAAGFTPAASDSWRAIGWDLDDALPWFVARFEPTPARVWRDGGFRPAEAAVWKGEHFGVRQAREWCRLGDTPEIAREVALRLAAARVTVAESLRWLDLGFTVDEICAGWPALAVGHDVGSWRAGWNRFALTPEAVAAWHAKFGRDEARQWLDAGVVDAATAARLRARGLEPHEVASVRRDRLADVFDAVPVTRDDLLSAAGHLARAGGSPDVRRRLELAVGAHGEDEPKEVAVDLIEDVLDELQRLDQLGQLGAPHAASALTRRLERGLIVSTLIGERRDPAGTPSAN
jgi:hypothetical protein